MTRKKNFPTVEIAIQKLSSKGNGVGIYNHPAGIEWTVEVPFTIPGDVVRARIYKKRSGTHQSFLEEVITPAPERRAPRCAHFGSCGGCRWQQMPYADQLKRKEELVRRSFQDMLGENVDFRAISPCEQEWEYRNKMEFSFSQNAADEKFLGLMMDSSRGKVINITECHLVRRWFVVALGAVREWWINSTLLAYRPRRDAGTLRTLTVREGMRSNDKMVMLTVSGNPDFAMSKEQISGFAEAVKSAVEREFPGDRLSIFLRIQQACKGKETSFYEMHLYGPDHLREVLHVQPSIQSPSEATTFHVSPSAFFQPNTYQAEKFYSFALQMTGATKESVVYDLFCGTGTIGLSIAKHVKEVVGIEMSPEAALDARTNATLNNISNYSVLCGDVRHLLKTILADSERPRPDILIIDPPRAGLDVETLESVLAFRAPKVVYISCNPQTQASNISAMVAAGYQLQAVQPVDQFPHTVHIENIAVLVLKE